VPTPRTLELSALDLHFKIMLFSFIFFLEERVRPTAVHPRFRCFTLVFPFKTARFKEP
jgi:hypothetical protein